MQVEVANVDVTVEHWGAVGRSRRFPVNLFRDRCCVGTVSDYDTWGLRNDLYGHMRNIGLVDDGFDIGIFAWIVSGTAGLRDWFLAFSGQETSLEMFKHVRNVVGVDPTVLYDTDIGSLSVEVAASFAYGVLRIHSQLSKTGLLFGIAARGVHGSF